MEHLNLEIVCSLRILKPGRHVVCEQVAVQHAASLTPLADFLASGLARNHQCFGSVTNCSNYAIPLELISEGQAGSSVKPLR